MNVLVTDLYRKRVQDVLAGRNVEREITVLPAPGKGAAAATKPSGGQAPTGAQYRDRAKERREEKGEYETVAQAHLHLGTWPGASARCPKTPPPGLGH